MKISNKKQQELWNIINEEIMLARIKIARIESGKDTDMNIDDVLFKLSIRAPELACGLFTRASAKTEC